MKEEKPEEQIKEADVIKSKKDNLNYFIEKGIQPYAYSYERTGSVAEILEKYKDVKEGEEGDAVEQAAGRLISVRGHGKTTFANIKDMTGKIQVYARKDDIGADVYADFKKMDIGDIVGVRGKVFRTRTGELTVKAEKAELLTKSLMPMPEKWHGLKDKETRYRRRYLDLMVNDEVKETFMTRTKVVKEIRNFLDEKGFIEVETPMMQAIPGGAKAKPFLTHHNTLGMDLYMRIAPELYLKRLLVGGFEKVYEINRNFRNEGISIKHNPEFTMMELYEAYADYTKVMQMTEDLIVHLADTVLGARKINYQGVEIDLSPPWRKLSMKEAVKEYAEIDVDSSDEKELIQKAREKGIEVRKRITKGELTAVIFEEFVEEKLMQPVFITEFPIEISPLSKVSRNNPETVERFEPYIFGREIGNGFSELNDALDQEKRFKEQIEMDTEGETAKVIDEDYIEALKYGMPPAGGLGIGIDRLVMFFTDAASIRDVILFPLMRPEKKENE
ncbi:MAG: lysine--tRNA ligase [Candidatus Goldiibacteriota bacterium]